MNRIIKFRAWDCNHKKYRYPKLWDNTMPSNWNEWFVLEQFTGLTDKNGTDIYEGNLYDDEGHILEVKYGQYEYAFDSECPVEYHVGFYVKRHTPNGWTIQPLDVVTHYDTVNLVGNIHEHPELICT